MDSGSDLGSSLSPVKEWGICWHWGSLEISSRDVLRG